MRLWLVVLCFAVAVMGVCGGVGNGGGDDDDDAVLWLAPLRPRQAVGELVVSVVQEDGRGVIEVAVRVPLVGAGVSGLRAVGVDGRIVTAVRFGAVVYEGGVGEVRMSVECLGDVGRTMFEVEASVEGAELLYGAKLRVTVGGVHVVFEGRVVSGGGRVGLGLGGFDAWVEGVQLGLSVRRQAVDEEGGLMLGGPLKVGLVGRERDAVEEGLCGEGGRLVRFGEGVDTLLARGEDDFEIVKARMSDGCGVGVSEDEEWLVLRFVPYRVSGYRFGVRIVWEGEGARGQQGRVGPGLSTWVDLNLSFDRNKVPPVVVQGFQATLDVFGNELLRIPVANSLKPPQRRELSSDDFSLRITAEEGDIYSIPAVDSQPVEGRVRESEIWFVTPVFVERPSKVANAEILYEAPRDGARTEDPSNLTVLTAPSVRVGDVQTAVVEPGETFSLLFAGAELASRGSCDQDEDIFRTDSFVQVDLDVPFYDEDSFSEHKKVQVEGFLGEQFQWYLRDGIRLVEVLSGRITFAVLVPRNVSQSVVDSDVSNFMENVSDEDVSFALGLPGDSLNKTCEVVKQLLCDAFPPLEVASSADISGFRLRLLPLWIFLAFLVAVAVVIAIVVLMWWKVHRIESPPPDEQFVWDDYDPDVDSQDSTSFSPAKYNSRSGGDAEFMIRMPVGVYGVEDNALPADFRQQYSGPMNSSSDGGGGMFHGLTNSLHGFARFLFRRDRGLGGIRRDSEVFREYFYSTDTTSEPRDRVLTAEWLDGLGSSQGGEPEQVYNPLESERVLRATHSSEHGFAPAQRALRFAHVTDSPANLDIHSMAKNNESNTLEDTSRRDLKHPWEMPKDKEIDEAVIEYVMKAAMDLNIGDDKANPQGPNRGRRMESALRAYARDLVGGRKRTGRLRRTHPIAEKTVDDAVKEYIKESLRDVQGSRSVGNRSIDMDLADSIFELMRVTSAEALGETDLIDQQSSSSDRAPAAVEAASRAETESSQPDSSTRTLSGPSNPQPTPTFAGVRSTGSKRFQPDASTSNGTRRKSSPFQGHGNQLAKLPSRLDNPQPPLSRSSSDTVAEVPWHNTSADRPVVRYENPMYGVTSAVGRSLREERQAQRTKRASSFMANADPSTAAASHIVSPGSQYADPATYGANRPTPNNTKSRPSTDRNTRRLAGRGMSFSFPSAKLLVERSTNSAKNSMRGAEQAMDESVVTRNSSGAQGDQQGSKNIEPGAASTQVTRTWRSRARRLADAAGSASTTDPASEKPYDSESSIEEVL